MAKIEHTESDKLIAQHFEDLIEDDSKAWKACYPAMVTIAYKSVQKWVLLSDRSLPDYQVDELVYKALFQLRNNMKTIKDGFHLCARIRTIAKRRTIDLFRNRRFGKDDLLQEDLTSDTASATSDFDAPLRTNAEEMVEVSQRRVLDKKEQAIIVADALEEIGDPCRSLLQAKYYMRMSDPEIGKQFEMSKSNVWKTIRTCKEVFKSLFEKLSGLALEEMMMDFV